MGKSARLNIERMFLRCWLDVSAAHLFSRLLAVLALLLCILLVYLCIAAYQQQLIRTIKPAVGLDRLMLIGLLAYLFGGIIKGVSGIGMALIAVPVMAMLVEPRVAVVLVAFPLMFTNLWQAIRDGGIKNTCCQYWRLAISMTFFMGLTAAITIHAPAVMVTLALGVVAIVFAAIQLGLNLPAIPDRLDKLVQWVSGTLAGVIGGVSGLVAIPLVAYMIARRADKESFVSVMGFLLLISGLVLAVSNWFSGVFTRELTAYSLLLVIPGMLGVLIGEKIRGYISPAAFRKLVLILIAVIGMNLLKRSIDW